MLLNELRPPAGSRLDAAVATTFTLDLTAALQAPLAFAAHQIGSGTPDPVAAMEAVRSCADRVDVFCQAGQIAIPARHSDLLAFVEPMVHEVRPPRPGRLFHPKVWLLRYLTDDGETSYRLLCLTRNLTNSHSWDAILRLDGGIPGRRPQAVNRPLFDLLSALPGMSTVELDGTRSERINQLAEDARRVEWELPDDVHELAFHVLGQTNSALRASSFEGYRHLIVAPFLNDAGIRHVTTARPQGTKISVVSRAEQLDRLDPTSLKDVSAHVFAVLAGTEETDLDQSASTVEPDDVGSTMDTRRPILGGLHAKLYVVERDKLAHVFIGSANATEAAFNGNIEFLVEMVGGASKLGVSAFLGPDAPFTSLIEPYESAGGAETDPVDEELRALEALLRDLAVIRYTATVSTDGDAYRITLTTAESLRVPAGHRLTAELLTLPGDSVQPSGGEPMVATFGPLALPDITPFLALRVTNPGGIQRGTVVRATLVGDPTGRLDAVLARQVDTPEKFMRFLLLLLGLAGPDLGITGSSADPSIGHAWAMNPNPAGLFELVVRALAERPDAIADLDRLVTRLRTTESGRGVLPEGFDTLWSTVTEARALLEED
ncbi:MAG TPA: phospholipase D family protein [Pseudonocardiaceae bacterium]|nr:phospholipase D family protein [Pseudonocardiaceae bacterium]